MIVIKFGGTSVGDAERVANAIDIVAERRDRKPIVVVSSKSNWAKASVRSGGHRMLTSSPGRFFFIWIELHVTSSAPAASALSTR